MAGDEKADGCTVRPVRRRPSALSVGMALAMGLVVPAAAGAAEPDPLPEATTTAPPNTTTTVPAPGSTSTSQAPPPPSSTTTTTWRDGMTDDEPLPPATTGTLPPENEVPPPPPGTPPPVAPPGADDAGRARAAAELRASEAALRKARAAERAMIKKLAPFERALGERRTQMESLAGQDREAADQLVAARTRMKKMAIAGYVHGGDTQPMDYLLRARDPVDFERRRTILETATEARTAAVKGYAVAQRGSSGRLEAAVAALDEAQAAHDIVAAERQSAAVAVYLLGMEVEEKRQLLDHAKAAALVGSTDIPRLFHDAYRKAAATLAKRAPHCRVPWTAIAGIAKIESNHGRYGGAQFALNGDVFPRILGIPLDGTRSALIRDTDGGVMDTDLEFDRAVGPMQFIPSTWVRINTDGNGDGTSDPNNAYDAALGTAAYLCRAVPSGGLDTDEGLRPAFFAYNHSNAYVEAVLKWHHTYAGTIYTPPPAPAA